MGLLEAQGDPTNDVVLTRFAVGSGWQASGDTLGLSVVPKPPAVGDSKSRPMAKVQSETVAPGWTVGQANAASPLQQQINSAVNLAKAPDPFLRPPEETWF